MAPEGVGVPSGVAGFGIGQRRLGHERPETGIVGLVFEEGELLLGDAQLGTEPLQPLAHVDEATLQDRPRHRTRQSMRR